ncbi:hypothetical protein [Variovorax sp. PAMC26660]|uniref:hypothetical protein n=1 Tax=Variovorax sp. PAMC26660 TaxID=2762322 RepID=UPI00164CF2AA|nr:hypothetical protein [Variovorax sp. PAMC26660]QNK67111.1 hypothetical protein H7F35_28755 [Variovorax sp. PAMC26660]
MTLSGQIASLESGYEISAIETLWALKEIRDDLRLIIEKSTLDIEAVNARLKEEGFSYASVFNARTRNGRSLVQLGSRTLLAVIAWVFLPRLSKGV